MTAKNGSNGFGVRVIREMGKFVSDREVEAGNYRITARRIVIATGSHAFVPPIKGLADVDYLTNETLWELREQPKHLLIIGGGPIGMEMAQAHRRLGLGGHRDRGRQGAGSRRPGGCRHCD